jgi:hypothetical protein
VKESLGSKVEGFKFTNPKKQDLYNTLKNELQNGDIAYEHVPNKNKPENKMVTQCLELERSYTSGGRMRIEHPPNGHDDFSDALALAVWAKSRTGYAHTDKESMKPFTLGKLDGS